MRLSALLPLLPAAAVAASVCLILSGRICTRQLAVLPQSAQAMACRAGAVTEPRAWLTTFQNTGVGKRSVFPELSPPDSILRSVENMQCHAYASPRRPSSTRPGFEAWGKLQTSLHSLLTLHTTGMHTTHTIRGAIWVKHSGLCGMRSSHQEHPCFPCDTMPWRKFLLISASHT